MMMVITALFLFQATLVSGLSNLSVTITTNVTDGIICLNKSVQLTCHANIINIATYNWTSTKFTHAEEAASITIIATEDPVGYTCTVTDTDGDTGYSSVNISSNATAPVLYEVNFNMDKTVFVGNHVNLTVQVISRIPLISMPLWSRLNADLPKDSDVVNYSQDKSNYTSLIIRKANYANDGGLYYLNTSNYCGPSGISVELNIDKEVECFPPGQPVPLLSITSNQTTVEEVAITYRCIFKGNYSPITYGDVYWVVGIQNGSSITILDNSNFTDYHVNTCRNCPHDNFACCQFVTELWILTTLPLNNAMISCVAIYDSVPSYNTSDLEVIERPVLTRGPTNVTGVMEGESVHFECHFNSSLIKYLAVCDWLKDGDPAMNGDKWQTTEPGFENRLICGFSITRVSMVDEGNYSCYCHYNESFREQLHIPKSEEIRSQSGKAVLLEIKSHKSAHEDQGNIIILCVVISCLFIPTVIIVIWRLEKCHKRKPAIITVRGTVDTDSKRLEVQNLISNEYSDESGDNSSNVSTQSPCSEALGPPTDESQPTDINESFFEQVRSTTVETLLPYQPNIQTRDNPALAAIPCISELITITEQPKNQIVQFKNNKEILKLTCCAESFKGHDLCYQWFYNNSNDIISTEQYAEIKLKRPYRNTEKKCYCKVSIVDQPQICVVSETIVIQLKIVWFTDQPKDTRVVAGKKLELSCTAETLQAMEVNYSWYKCSKSGTGKTPTGQVGNRMIIPVCDAGNDNYYLCEAAAVKQRTVFDTISSEVARVRVINSINISITKQPRNEVFITFGEKLLLECAASCGQHPVNYQWYNNKEPLAGATQPMLVISSVSEKDMGLYYCKITSEYSKAPMISKSTRVRMNYDKWNESQRSQVRAEEAFAMRKGKIYAKDKMALLIGNGDYKGNPLRCPKNDVKAIKKRLQRLNFKTLSLVDLTLSQTIDAINYFCSLLDTGMYAVFFYSGHGVEVHKTTYFVPIDADDKELKIVQLINSDLIAHKLQRTLAKVIMVLDCCRKTLPTEGMEMPTEQFSEYFSFNTICKIHACATSFETFEINDDENSFMTNALLQALDHSKGKMLKGDLYDRILKYYTNYNVPGSKGKQLIRPQILYALLKDLSLEDPILSNSRARDLLLDLPKKYSLYFNHSIMKSRYKSISLYFEAVYSNILIVHIYCNAAKQPILEDVKLLHNPGLSLVKLESKGMASYKISDLLLLIDVRERKGPFPKLQCTFHMPQDTSVIDQIEYEFS